MKTVSEDNGIRGPSLLVYCAVLCAQMGSISLGCSIGWSGPALADMSREDSQPHLTNDNDYDKNIKTWIGSSMTLGALFGGILSGFCIKFLGYKKTLILMAVPNTMGWLLLSFGRKIWILIVGRIITGTCSGIIIGLVPAYVTDVSTPKVRGQLGMAFNLFLVFGLCYIDLFLIWFRWEIASLAPILPAVVLSVSMFFMPESPNWLMSKFGRSIAVEEALHKLRHYSSDIKQELDELQEITKKHKLIEEGFNIKILIRQDVYKPMLIGICLTFFQQFSGINALQFYMTDLFKESGSSMRPELAVITVNGVSLVANFFAAFFIDRLGRRIMLSISGLIHAISLGVLGYHYFKHRTDTETFVTNSTLSSRLWSNSTAAPHIAQETSIVPVICLVVFVIGFSIGYGPVIWIVITEICSSNTVGLVISFSSSICWLFTFLVTKEFEDISRVATKYGAYWIFSGFSVLSVVFVIFLPETKGKTVEEIQRNPYFIQRFITTIIIIKII